MKSSPHFWLCYCMFLVWLLFSIDFYLDFSKHLLHLIYIFLFRVNIFIYMFSEILWNCNCVEIHFYGEFLDLSNLRTISPA